MFKDFLNVLFYEVEESSHPLFMRGKVDIFYKEENPNRTRFPENVFKEMLMYLKGAPVKGFWNFRKEDFEGHNKKKSDNQTIPLGFVSESGEITMTKKVDSNGVERNYATAEVLLWKHLYPYAETVITKNKKQSLEIDEETFQAEEVVFSDGKPGYEFKKAYISALCILGDDRNPAFEGSLFYEDEKIKEFNEALSYMKEQYNNPSSKEDRKGKSMPELNFRLAHGDIAGKLLKALNPVDEDGYLIWTYGLNKVFDDYAVVIDYKSDQAYRQFYSLSDEEVVLGERIKVDFIEATKEEQAKIDYEAKQKEDKIADYEKTVETLKEEKTSLEVKVKEAEEKITSYEEEVETLKVSKTSFEKELEEAKTSLVEVKSDYEKVLEEKRETEKKILEIEKEKVKTEFEGLLTEDEIKKVEAELKKEDDSAVTSYELDSALSAFYAKKEKVRIKAEKESGGIVKRTSAPSDYEELSSLEKFLLKEGGK